ncbi:MAG: ribosome biogenesis GTPase Der [Bacteroidota bacterium]|jgi:GTP-binding protein|nr:ribosome biogenesis GTPase Der [Bacteroidota bacterium]
MTKPIVAIVGRPNVGKSTLFNRIVGARQAIVHDEPGVTRDRHYAETDWAGREFVLIDTGGYVPESEDVFERAIREQVRMSIDEATVIVFVVDGQQGPIPMDTELANILRKSHKKVILVVNKIDSQKYAINTSEFFALGLGDPQPVSAISGRASGDLLDLIVEGFPEPLEEEEHDHMALAIIGRPNVGKSSITNAMLGHDRSIVTDVPGTTRDAIDSELDYNGTRVTLIDTAGLRRKSKVKENVEFYSTLRTIKSIQRCDVALCLLDGSVGLTHQDIDVLNEAVRFNKGVVIAVNKWDLVEKDDKSADQITKEIRAKVKMFDYIPVIFVSAMTKQRVFKALDLCLEVYGERGKRIPTSELNDRIIEILRATPPPASPTGKQVKFFYATQVRESPPVIVLFANEPKHIPESYRRFVVRQIREIWSFKGVPLTVQFRKTKPD